MRTEELLERLRRHYIKPGEGYVGGVFLPEVGWNGRGPGSRCDALYVGFTSTSGRKLIGHELKVSRADWRHELAQPGKADGWGDQCHAWFVVAPSEEVVPREELPHGWGLMVPGKSKTRMQVLVRPEYLDRTPSWDAARSLLARADTLYRQSLGAATQEVRRRERAVEHREQELQRHGKERLDEATKARIELVERLEQSLGVELRRYGSSPGESTVTPEELAAALRLVEAAKRMSPASAQWAANEVERTAQRWLEGVQELRDAGLLLQRLAGARNPQ